MSEFIPQFEQGYVSGLDLYGAQPLSKYLLPTAQTVALLAKRFGAKVESRELVIPRFFAFIPVDGSAQVSPTQPFFGPTKPIIERSLTFPKGKTLPSGYTLQGDVTLLAWFLAYAFVRNVDKYAETDCWDMVEKHEKQVLGIEY